MYEELNITDTFIPWERECVILRLLLFTKRRASKETREEYWAVKEGGLKIELQYILM